MISIKSKSEIEFMRHAARILSACFKELEPMFVEGVRTIELDQLAEAFFNKNNSIPSFKGVPGMMHGAPDYPACLCISVNDEVIHGLPGNRKLQNGDIVSIDMGVIYKGYHSDMARTYCVGEVSQEAKRLIQVTEESFFKGITEALPGKRISDISAKIQEYIEKAGFSVVRDFVGHGIGTELHEPPQIPNFVSRDRGPKLQAGMTLAIEPMVNAGHSDVYFLANKWTVATKDHSLSAHYENTILICEGEPEILTIM